MFNFVLLLKTFTLGLSDFVRIESDALIASLSLNSYIMQKAGGSSKEPPAVTLLVNKSRLNIHRHLI